MLCYDIRVRYEPPNPFMELTFCGEENDKKKNEEQDLEERLQKLNAGVYALTSENDFYAVAYRADDDFLDFAVAAWPEKITINKIANKLEWAVNSIYNVAGSKAVSISEITARKYTMMIEESDNRGYLKRRTRKTERDLELDYFDNSFFKTNEILAPCGKLSKKNAVEKAKELMADISLYEEIDRIYARENSRKFYGYPVHYRIQTGNREVGMTIVSLMVQMLHSRGRIISSRINLVTEIEENCYDESDLENLFRHADGGAVVIEMRGSDEEHGNFATSYEGVIRFFASLVEKYHHNTLFFFLEDVTSPGFTRELISKAADYVDIIEISEGAGNRNEALSYFRRLIKQNSFKELGDDSRTYGDEAINTIVQEMENRRNSVIVIFAGYPDKMKEFFDRNEGLRSRIAFHLDFPDYKEDELIEIMGLMLKERGLRMDAKARGKCHDIFARACGQREFGNGRFVRNLIEQAMLRQAKRLMGGSRRSEIPRSSVEKLTVDDFDVNIAEIFDNKRKVSIGFAI